MINIIIVEDNQKWMEYLKKELDKILFSLDISFNIITFSTFDKKLKTYISNNNNTLNIYILDIVLKQHNGLDIANYIRNKALDWDSFILFNTNYQKKYEEKIYQGKYGFLRFLLKDSKNYALELEDAIRYAIKTEHKRKSICLKTQNMIYRFYTQDILYVEYVDRKSKICTNYTTASFNISLTELKTMLGDDFMYSHKACLVNTKKIKKIDKKEKIIYFDDGITTNLLSKKHLKELIYYLEHKN